MEKSIEWTNEKGASRRLDVYVKTADSLKKKWQRATSTGEVHIEDVAAPMMSDCVLVFPFREVLKMARAAVKVLGKNDAAK